MYTRPSVLLSVRAIRNIPLQLVMTILVSALISLIMVYYYSITMQISTHAQELLHSNSSVIPSNPYVYDSNLTVETVATGLRFPTDMAFLSNNDILVLEKDNGTVRRVVNGTVLQDPLLDVPVATKGESGMLGIDIVENVGQTN